MRRHAPFEPIYPKTCVWGGIPNIINCAIFLKIGQGVSEHTPKTAFPIESVHRPYNNVSITVLHCHVRL